MKRQRQDDLSCAKSWRRSPVDETPSRARDALGGSKKRQRALLIPLASSGGQVHQNRLLRDRPRRGGPDDARQAWPKVRAAASFTRPLAALAIEGHGHRHQTRSLTCTTASPGQAVPAPPRTKHQLAVPERVHGRGDQCQRCGCSARIRSRRPDPRPNKLARDPFAAHRAVVSWDASLRRGDHRSSEAPRSRRTSISCHRIGESYADVAAARQNCLAVLKAAGTPAAKERAQQYAIDVLRGMRQRLTLAKVPADAPTSFIQPRWQKLVMRRRYRPALYYELCLRRNFQRTRFALSGGIWVQDFAPVQDFEDCLVPPAKFASLKLAAVPLAVATGATSTWNERLTLLETQRHGQPPGGGVTTCRMPSSPVGPEDHAAGCGGA